MNTFEIIDKIYEFTKRHIGLSYRWDVSHFEVVKTENSVAIHSFDEVLTKLTIDNNSIYNTDNTFSRNLDRVTERNCDSIANVILLVPAHDIFMAVNPENAFSDVRAEEFGYVFHRTLRTYCDSFTSISIHNLIYALPPKVWNSFCEYCSKKWSEGMNPVAAIMSWSDRNIVTLERMEEDENMVSILTAFQYLLKSMDATDKKAVDWSMRQLSDNFKKTA